MSLRVAASALRARISAWPSSTSCLTRGSEAAAMSISSWTRQAGVSLPNSTCPPRPSSAVAMQQTSGLPRSSLTSMTRNFTFGGNRTSLSLAYALNSLMSAGANSHTSSSYIPSGGSTFISNTICPQFKATFLSVVVDVKAVHMKSLPGTYIFFAFSMSGTREMPRQTVPTNGLMIWYSWSVRKTSRSSLMYDPKIFIFSALSSRKALFISW
mmetsp:Transcript_27553/g.79431  ORF Transcript_27553/g.79431 Transcript_27553/m.79431 type:complete len:212 (-) Transcript_27553:341-976(-)